MRKTRAQWLASVLPFRAPQRERRPREKAGPAPLVDWLCRLPWDWAGLEVRARAQSEARGAAKKLVPGGRLPPGTVLERKGEAGE